MACSHPFRLTERRPIVVFALLTGLLPPLPIGCASGAEPFHGQPYHDRDLYADTWVATDALGRTQPGRVAAGPRKKEKWVGIFYWTWHVPRGTGGPNDNTQLQYNQEYSRDCEPMIGGHTDNYAYQLASSVRHFKGMRPRPVAQGPSAIAIDGQFDDWDGSAREFRDTIGDVIHRNHRGYGDFVIFKAAYDAETLYFFAQTRVPVTPHTDPMWMLLLLDTDQDTTTGWLG